MVESARVGGSVLPSWPRRRSVTGEMAVSAEFTRRDFLNATLLASGGALLGGASPLELLAAARDLDFDGYGGIGDYARANGNTLAVLTEGHKIRTGVDDRIPART